MGQYPPQKPGRGQASQARESCTDFDLEPPGGWAAAQAAMEKARELGRREAFEDAWALLAGQDVAPHHLVVPAIAGRSATSSPPA